ncbi:Efflux pump dotC [Fusarium oxysporum f. sp. albedinis]|nr:Efflux pump dotC [Fusarium oxysporum f. sp. albedinis]
MSLRSPRPSPSPFIKPLTYASPTFLNRDWAPLVYPIPRCYCSLGPVLYLRTGEGSPPPWQVFAEILWRSWLQTRATHQK